MLCLGLGRVTCVAAMLIFVGFGFLVDQRQLFYHKQLLLSQYESLATTGDEESMLRVDVEVDVDIAKNKQSIKKIPSSSSTTERTTTAYIKNQPIFVLSLPNNADLAIPRYFECAGLNVARHWYEVTNKNTTKRKQIGACFLQSLEHWKSTNRSINALCEKQKYDVYTDLQILEGPSFSKGRGRVPSQCYDPVLHPGSLEKLYESYPNATIVAVRQNPDHWWKTLSSDMPKRRTQWCPTLYGYPNATQHNNNNKEAWIQFYNEYYEGLRTFVSDHPSWGYAEIDFQDFATSNPSNKQQQTLSMLHKEIGLQLEQQLGIDQLCWLDSVVSGKVPNQETTFVTDGSQYTQSKDQMNAFAVRPNSIRYPIFVASLPKSGTSTTHNYFTCGLGRGQSAHQWSLPSKVPVNATAKSDFKSIPIGSCMYENTQNNQPILEGCGNAKVWTDTGVLRFGGRNKTKLCYMPSVHKGLNAFYKQYPYGTILLLHRNATDWYKSAVKWNKLTERWSKVKCKGFPSQGSNESTWVQWYEDHTRSVRQFARDHPTMTYLEAPLSPTYTGEWLHSIFGFPEECWGHSNINDNSRSANKSKQKEANGIASKNKTNAKE